MTAIVKSSWFRSLSRHASISLTIILMVTGASVLHAQGFGSIQGVVTDSTGASIPGASITVTQTQTGGKTQAVARSGGAYVLPSLPPALYSLTVAAPGFSKYTQSGIVLQADQAATVNVVLKNGSVDETITVTSDAVAVDTTTGTLSQVIGTRQTNDLPLNGRNAAQLTTLVPGAVLAPNNGTDQGQTKTFPVAVVISANGSRGGMTNYMLNGGNNVDEYTNANAPFPFPDALQEFSIETSNYSAEYGQNAGGVVNIITKSGGSQFHGTVFEYVRNRAFNAANYFGYLNGVKTVDPLKRNQFGGTIGGPIWIPHVTSRDKSFFFVGFQKQIWHDVTNGLSANVPTIANQGGDFSALLSATNPNNPTGKAIQLVYPNIASKYGADAGQPIPGNKINPLYIDPTAVNFEKDLPQVGGNGFVTYSKPISQTFTEYFARGDQLIGVNDHLFLNYYYDSFNNAPVLDLTNLLSYTDGSNITYQNALISESHQFTPSILNNLIINYQHEISQRGPGAGAPSVGTFGASLYQPTPPAIQKIATDNFSIGDNPHAVFQRNNYTLAEDLHWVKGAHTLGFGAHIELSKIDTNSLFNQPGAFTFNSTTTGYSLASLQLGYMYSFLQGNGQYLNDRNHFLGFYAQDSWKVTRRLTLDYGIRYEPFSPWREIFHRTELFSPSARLAGTTSQVFVNAPAGLLFPGDEGVPTNGVRDINDHFMPRFGFAWDVLGNETTVLRGGAGIFYNTRMPGIFNSAQATETPFSVQVTLTQPTSTFSNPYGSGTYTNPFPTPTVPTSTTAFPSPVTVATLDPSGNFKVPVTYEWNLTGEQQVTHNLLARLAYVGSRSNHLAADLELNPSIYGQPGNTDQRRYYNVHSAYPTQPIPTTTSQLLSNVSEGNFGAVGNYNSLQLSLQERVSRGLTFTINYTWSKALDNVPISSGNDIAIGPGESYVYPFYFPNFKALDYGPSPFDHRHVMTATYLYAIPPYTEGPSYLRAVINGWEFSGIVTAQTGDELTVKANGDVSQTNILQDRAVRTGQPWYGGGGCTGVAVCKTWLNPAGFAQPPAPTSAMDRAPFGNDQRGSQTGPNDWEWDAGIIRSFHIVHDVHFDFRAEYFNLLNHTNLGDPNIVVGTGHFGGITSTGNFQSRIAQFSGKFVF